MHTTVDKDLELEGTLPDFCPDISRLIRVDCIPYIDSSDVNGDKCLVTGKVVCSILYETDYKNKIKSAVFAKDFSHSFEVQNQNCITPISEAKIRCSHISCKMLSPRKFIIKPRMQLDLDVYCNSIFKTADTQSGDNTFFKTKEITFEKKLPAYTEEFSFDEENSLLSSEKPIGDIVFGTIRLQPPQVTISGNDAHVKTNAVIKVLYEEENSDNELVMATKIIPISMTLSNLDVNESGKINVVLTVTDEKISSELDAYGENRIIKADFTVRAKADMSEKVSEVVATDLFSTDYINKTESTTVALPMLAADLERNFAIDTVVNPERQFTFPLFDIDTTINDVKAELVEGGINLSGEYTTSILGLTADGYESVDTSGTFNEFVSLDLPENVTNVEVNLLPFDNNTTLLPDGNIALRIMVNARIKAYAEDQQTFISNILSQDPIVKDKETYAVIYYYPSKKDNLWNIAKKYYVNPTIIKNANPNAFDEQDQLKTGTRMVLIKK
ncbi:MAG: hypothetical protein A2Y15_01935 [Clostridiales bacterium GWF2_36_10]|nr:MAG: hypothetical protein A2Y15_01935 [Clostridiales bacterium GWF2_36_10]